MFLQVRESGTQCKGSSSLVPEAIVPRLQHSPAQHKERSLTLLCGTVVALFSSSPRGIAAEHYYVSTATGQQREPSVQERCMLHICLFRIIIQFFFLQAVQIHSANGVKLLQAGRGVLSSTPPYK
jgi:hypothetical protein